MAPEAGKKANGKGHHLLAPTDGAGRPGETLPADKLETKTYLKELESLQFELIKLQEWIRLQGLKVVVLFEGRDAASKGGTIKRITESLNPRVCRVVVLGTPT